MNSSSSAQHVAKPITETLSIQQGKDLFERQQKVETDGWLQIFPPSEIRTNVYNLRGGITYILMQRAGKLMRKDGGWH